MEVGLQSGYVANGGGPPPPAGILAVGDVQRTNRSPAKTGLHVNFKDKGEIKEKREKFLTAKYGHHQMSLIRKRLAVEMWLYEELKKLYDNKRLRKSQPSGGRDRPGRRPDRKPRRLRGFRLFSLIIFTVLDILIATGLIGLEIRDLVYTSKTEENGVNNEEVEVDIDELLDMDSDDQRRTHLQNLLINAKGPQSDVKKFINDLLEKAKTL